MRILGAMVVLAFVLAGPARGEEPSRVLRVVIAAHEIHDLPRCARRLDPRVLLRAEVLTPWGPLQAYSTHTSRDDCQVRRIAELVREHRGPLPSLVLGDFNAGEQLSVIQTLTNGGGFIDAFRAVNPTVPGFTVWQRIAAPGPTVVRRVDYIFVMPGLDARGRVVASRVVLDEPTRLADGAALWPSDHYGVFAEVEIGPTARETARATGR